MSDLQPTTSESSELAGHHLGPETFESFYHTVIGLRFPMDVAQVLELRYVINNAVDSFDEPVTTQDYREFRDALQSVIDATGIDNKHHGERMLRILALIRELHYAYSINVRDQENHLHEEIALNREQRLLSRRYSVIYGMGTGLAAAAWISLSEPTWMVQVLTLSLAVGAWLHLRALPALDRKLKALELRLQLLQRERVKSIHWRVLVQKLALVLGFKHDSKVEVFHLDDPDRPKRSRSRTQVRH
jgi:hypothetical protein